LSVKTGEVSAIPQIRRFLDLGLRPTQTQIMAHIYLLFDFAQNEEKAQQARHKLESWKQAFRLDKKLLYKVERTGAASSDGDSAAGAKPTKSVKAKGKSKGASKPEKAPATSANEDIKLFIRLAFSGHEKLSEQRWVQRIPAEEPFHEASPKVVKAGDEGFDAIEKQFEELT
jgi:hypothetical protein